jgi:hypothetical protein
MAILLFLVIIFALLYLVAKRSMEEYIEYEVTLVDDEEEDGAW